MIIKNGWAYGSSVFFDNRVVGAKGYVHKFDMFLDNTKKEYGIELSKEDMTKFNDMVNAIRTEYPARYFETRFERPLQLSDFTAAVVPNDIPSDVESRLKKENIIVIPRVDSSGRGNSKSKEGRHLHIAKGSAERKPEVQRMIDEAKAQMRKK